MLKKLVPGFLIVFLFISVSVPVQAANSARFASADRGQSPVIFANLLDDILQDVIGDAIKQWFSNLLDSFFGGKSNPGAASSGTNSSAANSTGGSSRYIDPSYDPAKDSGDGCYREETIDGQEGFWYQGHWYWRWTNDVGYTGPDKPSAPVSNIPLALTLIGVGNDPNPSSVDAGDTTTQPDHSTTDSPPSSPPADTSPPPSAPPAANGGNTSINTPQTNSGAVDLLGQEAPYVEVPDFNLSNE